MNVKNNSEICKLIVKGYFAQAKDRINNNSEDLNQIDENRRTPLLLCSFIDDNSWAVSLARLLLELGAEIDRNDNNQMNAIHYCIIFEQVDLLKILLESVDFDINKGDCYGNSPLIYAIVSDSEEITNILIQYYKRYKIDVDKRNLRGINAYMQACLSGNLDVMEKLENIGINKSVKDNNGKSSYSYKEDALAKSELENHINKCRSQSKLVRFDDIERIIKLQQESDNLKSNAQKFPEFVDHNLERLNQLKTTLKKVKRNKIDTYFVSKNLKNLINISEHILINDNFKQRQFRPRSEFSTSKSLINRKDWYSFLGPLFTSLEQQYSSSFKQFTKSGVQNNDPIISINDKSKGRQRKLSRSLGSQSRRNSISSRMTLNDDSLETTTNKSRKKLDSSMSTKSAGRNVSRSTFNPTSS